MHLHYIYCAFAYRLHQFAMQVLCKTMQSKTKTKHKHKGEIYIVCQSD